MAESNQSETNPVPPEEEKAKDITKEVYSQLTGGERLAVIGAGIILVFNLLIGDIILDSYHLSNLSWLLPLGVVLAVFFYYRGKQAAWHRFYPWMVEVAGWATAGIGVVSLLGTISGSFPSGGSVLFALGFWVAAGLMGGGAYLIHQDRTARFR